MFFSRFFSNLLPKTPTCNRINLDTWKKAGIPLPFEPSCPYVPLRPEAEESLARSRAISDEDSKLWHMQQAIGLKKRRKMLEQELTELESQGF